MTLPNSSSINAFGSGILHDAVPLVDPTTEIGAAALNPLRNDVSACTMVVPRLIFQYADNGYGPAVQTSITWTSGLDAVWGNSNTYYPVVSRSSTGVINFTLPSTVPDQIGNSNLVNIRAVTCSVMSGTTPAFLTCVVTASNTFTINQFNSSGSASNLANILLFVQVY